MLPMTLGFLLAGPASGFLSDRFGARSFATGGMLIAAASFVWLLVLPVNFSYWLFAAALLVNGIGMGMFASPNWAGIMNSLPPAAAVGGRDEYDLPELRHGALDRYLLLPDGHRAVGLPAGRDGPAGSPPTA